MSELCTHLPTSASNVSGFGTSQKVGHLDFFPNGGKEMPGCQKNILSTIVDVNGIWEGMCVREKGCGACPVGMEAERESLATVAMDSRPSVVSSESGISQRSKIFSVFGPMSYM